MAKSPEAFAAELQRKQAAGEALTPYEKSITDSADRVAALVKSRGLEPAAKAASRYGEEFGLEYEPDGNQIDAWESAEVKARFRGDRSLFEAHQAYLRTISNHNQQRGNK